MIYAIILLIIIVMILAIRLFMIKRAVREIEEKISFELKEDTNILIDVSSSDKDIRRLAARLNVELAELRKRQIKYENGDREIKNAVANISHDLRTPLTAICGYLDFLEKEEMSDNARRYTGIISERTHAMKVLTEELFRYSVAVSADDEPELEDITVNDVLEESITGFYAVLKEKKMIPEIKICDEKVVRHLSKTALSRIFSNIINNAVRYSSGDLKIELENSGRVIFSNKTEKLDKVTAGRLFDRFYTVETAGKGTGLGLSIARALTERLGGSIFAEYEDGSIYIIVEFLNS